MRCGSVYLVHTGVSTWAVNGMVWVSAARPKRPHLWGAWEAAQSSPPIWHERPQSAHRPRLTVLFAEAVLVNASVAWLVGGVNAVETLFPIIQRVLRTRAGSSWKRRKVRSTFPLIPPEPANRAQRYHDELARDKVGAACGLAQQKEECAIPKAAAGLGQSTPHVLESARDDHARRRGYSM